MIELFKTELEAVHGELFVCSSEDEARSTLERVLKEQDGSLVVRGESELLATVGSGVGARSCQEMDKEEIASASHSLLEASILFAETGSCLVHNTTREDRFACYLPEKCVVIAKASGLKKNIDEGWGELAEYAATAKGGESVILTGPSRTADIEKILIVGAHGPKKLTVLILNDL